MAAVLLVDSDAFTRHLLRIALEVRWHSVFEATSDRTALALLADYPDPLVVVLSTRMPPRDGQQLLQAVATDRTLRERHGYLVLTEEAGWLPPAFQPLAQRLLLRRLVPLHDLPVLWRTVTELAARLPSPSSTRPRPPRFHARESA